MAEIKTLLAVGEIADKNIITIPEGKTVREAAVAMQDQNASALLVLSESGSVTGIITEQDIVRRGVAAAIDLEKSPVTDVMTPNPIVIDSTESIFEAKKIMSSQEVHHLIVVKDDKPVGILTAKNVLGG
jgi:CBS domain-containing protein